MRAIRSCVVLSLLIAVEGVAFESYEHRALSNAAFLAAKRSVDPAAISAEMLRQTEARLGGAVTLGDVTLAVDWFQHPEMLLDPATVERNMARRRRNLPARGLAAHQNARHFQAAALSDWQKYHARAVELAANNPSAALLAEAVALHFLQDFFAAGHLVTPRKGMHDAAAGHLHDRFNRRGVAFSLSPLPAEVETILQNLVAAQQLTPAERSTFEAAGQAPILFNGDGYIAANQIQKAFVMVVSSLSAAEVLTASNHANRSSLQACFAKRRIVEEKVPMKIDGPDGGIRISEPLAPRVVANCSSSAAWLGHYGARDDPELKKPDYDLGGLNVRGAFGVGRRSRDSRVDLEALYLANSDDPPGALLGPDGKAYAGSSGMLMTLGPTYSRGTRYRAWGGLADYTFITGTDLLSWGARTAVRRYSYAPGHAWRLDFGVKLAVGYQVVNVFFAADRMHTVDSVGKFAHDYFGSLGVDAAFSGTWLRPSRYRRRTTHVP